MPALALAAVRRVAWLALLLLTLPGTGPVRAARFPLDCTLGRDCWVVRVPGPRALAGGVDGPWSPADEDHRGLDIAVPDLLAMIEGIAVRALVAGTVVAVRDGEADGALGRRGREAVAGRECGNGVRIRAADGLLVQYCHLRRGSVMVRRGDRVDAGALLGLVGLSGLTNFPHLHLQLAREGWLLDPRARFPELFGPIGDPRAGPLPVVTGVGLAVRPPRLAQVLRGDFRGLRRVARTAPALVLWVRAFHLRRGDLVDFRIRGPEGRLLFQQLTEVEKDRALGMRYAGRRRPGGGWRPGTYRAEVTVRRGDAVRRETFTFTVE